MYRTTLSLSLSRQELHLKPVNSRPARTPAVTDRKRLPTALDISQVDKSDPCKAIPFSAINSQDAQKDG